MFDWCKHICKYEPTPFWISLIFVISLAIYTTVGSFLLEKLFSAIKKEKKQ